MEYTAYGSTAASSTSGKWYYMDGGKKTGPVNVSKLTAMLESGELSPETRVWTAGMEKWSPAADTDLMNPANGQKQAPVVVSLNASEQPAPKKKSRWWIWLIVGILLVAGIAAAVYFLFFHQKAPETPEGEVEEVITYVMDNYVVYESDECAFLIDTIGEKGDYLELDVRCVNKTDDTLYFAWESTCINGSMFDPLWSVYVQANSTMKSSITFPLSTLESYNLLPAEQIKFVLAVHNVDQFDRLRADSSQYILSDLDVLDEKLLKNYKRVEGYDGYLFAKSVEVDKDGRPYYVNEDKTAVYFDEIYTAKGYPLYDFDTDISSYESFYNDSFGRPYYFTDSGSVVYYDGYGYAFTDEESGKHYFYDEAGDPAYYGNSGIPEYYEGTAPQDMDKPNDLAKAGGSNLVHKEFAIYPTGKDADEVTYPNRIFAASEQIYWEGEKGTFIVLGGTMDEFKGYIVHTYIRNDSDNYIYFGWDDVVVNGVSAYPDSVSALRPHSSCYRDIIIPAELLEDNKVKAVEEIDFRVYAVGENLSVPLYPIAWDAAPITGVTK